MSGPHGYPSLFKGCIVTAVLIGFVIALGFIFMAVPR